MTYRYPLKQIGQYAYSLKDPLLGKTRNSEVYSGFNTLTDEPVAIKSVKLKSLDQFQKKSLEAEIQIMHSLSQSLHIIKIYQVIQTQDQICLVMEKCTSDLQKLLKKEAGHGQGLNQRKAMKLMNQILIGYKKIFKNFIIHRDLKLANIFLVDEEVRIADFGFAIKTSASNSHGMIKTRENVGSPLYMAPESLEKNIYSFKSDIWALGVIYYELLFGKMPWLARSEDQLLKQINSFSVLNRIPSKVNKLSEQFLKKTICRDATARFSPEQLINFSFPCTDSWRNIDAKSALKIKSCNQLDPSSNILLSVRNNQQLRNFVQSPRFCTSRNPIYASIEKIVSKKDIDKKTPNKKTSIIQVNKIQQIEKGQTSLKTTVSGTMTSRARDRPITYRFEQSTDKKLPEPNSGTITKREGLARTGIKSFYATSNGNLNKERKGGVIKYVGDLVRGDLNKTLNLQMEKNITELLKYEVHFCRFLIKIIEKTHHFCRQQIQFSLEGAQKLLQAAEIYILCRTWEAKELKRLDSKIAAKYKQSSMNYRSTVDYAKKYYEKYATEFKKHLPTLCKQKDYRQNLYDCLTHFIERDQVRMEKLYQTNLQRWHSQTVNIDCLTTIKGLLFLVDQTGFHLHEQSTKEQLEADARKLQEIVGKLNILKKYC